MKVIDRSVAPPLGEIQEIKLPRVEQLWLSNGISVWSINAGTQDVIKIELIFRAGRWQEPKRAVSSTTSKMLLDGTATKSSHQIAEEIEFYGASVHTDAAVDYSLVQLFTLNKHLPSLMPLLREVIMQPVFPDKELHTHTQNSKQRLMVNLQKVDFLAHKEFNERLYGSGHPNGYTPTNDDYDGLEAEVLRNFHREAYVTGPVKMIIAGKVSDEVLHMADNYFGKDSRSSSNGAEKNTHAENTVGKKFFVEKKDALQSGIRIGKQTINKLHPDFQKLRVLNTVLGGYFGSRLMQNLREDKGFCYGVHSGLASYLQTANVFITTEVGKDVTGAAVHEIYNEVSRLREERIPEDELRLVKNYLLGVVLADADGPFNVAEIIRGLVVYDLDVNHFYNNVNIIKSVTSEELLQLAQKYLDPDSMIEVVAGLN